ncbi:MAG: lytic transglycosylase domain-containing protein [Vitreoscilla sp.]
MPSRLRAAVAAALGAAAATTHADCIDDAATRHQVNALVLRAIGWHESRLQPAALGRNANGSIDVGAFQINSVHLSELGRYGIDRKALADGCLSAEVAAWHYRRQVDAYGDNWQAVGAYHSQTAPRASWYANQIAAVLMRWNAMPAGALPFPGERTLAPGRAPAPPGSAPGFTPSPRVNAVPSSEGDTRITFSEIAYLPSAR